jgi:hypothetical protein
MMDEHLRDLLTPADDGRGFTDAVLMRAAGALHRRRAHAETDAPVLGWLGVWARPWLVAALVALAVLGVLPALPPAPTQAASQVTLTDEVEGSVLPPEVVAVAVPEGKRE